MKTRDFREGGEEGTKIWRAPALQGVKSTCNIGNEDDSESSRSVKVMIILDE